MIDLLVTNIKRLVTCASNGPLRAADLSHSTVVEHAAIAIDKGLIIDLGPTNTLAAKYTARETVDATGYIGIPGFVDPHTHCCYAGDRADEFVRRIQGATYTEIMAEGGGIMSTVTQTREVDIQELVKQTRARLDRMLQHGITTAEVKTGYGLSTESELRMLEAIAELQRSHPIDIIPTFLGAHAIPAAHRDTPEAYVDLLINDMVPSVATWWQQQSVWEGQLACDVFCEAGVFSLEQSRRILEAAQTYGFAVKLHVDEFEALGGTTLGVELGAWSVDHLVATREDDISALAHSDTVAVSLPGTPFGLAHSHYTPARKIIEAGGILALATDCNPGTSVCESMPMIIALACRYLKLTPTEALHAATLNAAYALKKGDQLGSIQVGKQADLVLLDLPHEHHLGYRFGTNPVAMVFKHGKCVINHINTLPI